MTNTEQHCAVKCLTRRRTEINACTQERQPTTHCSNYTIAINQRIKRDATLSAHSTTTLPQLFVSIETNKGTVKHINMHVTTGFPLGLLDVEVAAAAAAACTGGRQPRQVVSLSLRWQKRNCFMMTQKHFFNNKYGLRLLSCACPSNQPGAFCTLLQWLMLSSIAQTYVNIFRFVLVQKVIFMDKQFDYLRTMNLLSNFPFSLNITTNSCMMLKGCTLPFQSITVVFTG